MLHRQVVGPGRLLVLFAETKSTTYATNQKTNNKTSPITKWSKLRLTKTPIPQKDGRYSSAQAPMPLPPTQPPVFTPDSQPLRPLTAPAERRYHKTPTPNETSGTGVRGRRVTPASRRPRSAFGTFRRDEKYNLCNRQRKKKQKQKHNEMEQATSNQNAKRPERRFHPSPPRTTEKGGAGQAGSPVSTLWRST